MVEDPFKYIHLDILTYEGCIIESWNRKERTIAVRYQDGRSEELSDVALAYVMMSIGRKKDLSEDEWKHSKNYGDLSEGERKTFRQTLDKLAQKRIEELRKKGLIFKKCRSIKTKITG